MKNLTQTLFRFIFKHQIQELEQKIKSIDSKYSEYVIQHNRLTEILNAMDISADVSERIANSFAVISIQGKKDFIRFIDLGERDLREIQKFLHNFDRRKVDASDRVLQILRHNKNPWRGGY